MGHLISETLVSCFKQDYENLEVIVLDDASTDNTKTVIDALEVLSKKNLKYYRSDEPSGTGGSFNKAMKYASGEFIMFLCADDIITSHKLVSDIVQIFQHHPSCIHVSRWYHQFIDGDRRPVRAWRGSNKIELANNPSGLAFRKSAIGKCQFSNKMFVEASSFLWDVLQSNRYFLPGQVGCVIISWDAIAVRIHNSISRNKDYYKKRWVSSPVEEWSKVGGDSLQHDFTSLIQIKNHFTNEAVLKETWNFIRLRPTNLLMPVFWFLALVAILTPRFILRHVPHWYRVTIGRWTTKEIKRPE